MTPKMLDTLNLAQPTLVRQQAVIPQAQMPPLPPLLLRQHAMLPLPPLPPPLVRQNGIYVPQSAEPRIARGPGPGRGFSS